MRVEKYLDDAITRHGLKNDTALAKLLGVRQNAVSQYRSGTRTMDNEMCLRLAQLLDMENPMPIIMAADMDRAERAGQRSLWEVFSPRMAHSGLMAVLVALGLGVTNFVTPSPAEAAPLSHSPALNTLHYVKLLAWISTRLKQALRAIQASTKPATA
jgi:plasmid maintenance system antidote protein VapI